MTRNDGKPLDSGLVARVAQGLRYIVSGTHPADWFGPEPPPSPMAPADIAGRQFDYPSGFNLNGQPRTGERISFRQLRELADSYDLLRLVIETRKDQMEKLVWAVAPRGDQAGPIPTDAARRIAAVTRFFQRPDGEHGWSAWLRILLEDLFVIDAPTLFLRRSENGRLYALEPVDGSTIKRVIDAFGRTPQPPEPAYQQVLKGLPAVDYSRDDLLYLPRNPRSHKVYGYSPVEQIIMTVNIALRRQTGQLSYYTEGNVPEALIGVPDTWTPDQIHQFQDYWDALLEGNLAARRHARFVPGALTYHPTKTDTLKDEYDEWLARIICYAFSVSPAPLSRMMNRATASSVHQAALTEGLVPLQNWVKQFIDLLLEREFASADLEFTWVDGDATDPLAAAQINEIYVRSGIKSINEVRAELGLAPRADDVGLPPTARPPSSSLPTTGLAATTGRTQPATQSNQPDIRPEPPTAI